MLGSKCLRLVASYISLLEQKIIKLEKLLPNPKFFSKKFNNVRDIALGLAAYFQPLNTSIPLFYFRY